MPIGWNNPSAWTSLTITLNGVVDGNLAVSTTTITNGTGLDLYADFSLILGSINPTGAPYVELHIVPLLHDGTSYADAVISGATMVAALPVTTGSSIKDLFFGPPRTSILIPPGTFQVGIGNRTGQTFAGSGNALQYRTYKLS